MQGFCFLTKTLEISTKTIKLSWCFYDKGKNWNFFQIVLNLASFHSRGESLHTSPKETCKQRLSSRTSQNGIPPWTCYNFVDSWLLKASVKKNWFCSLHVLPLTSAFVKRKKRKWSIFGPQRTCQENLVVFSFSKSVISFVERKSAFLKVERATYMKKALTKASYLPCNSSIFSVN